MGNKKAFMALSATLVLTIFFSIEINNFLSSLQSKKEEIYKENGKILNSVIQIEKDRLKTIAIQLSLSSIVKQALKEGNATTIKDEFFGVWENLKKEGLVSEVHFFTPPSTSFVNFSDFERFGHDTRESRGDMFWAMSSFKSSEHLLVCRTYPGIRATYPIEFEGELIGGISVGKNINYIPKIIKNDFDKGSVIAYKQSPFEGMHERFKSEFLSSKTLIGDLYIDNQEGSLSKEDMQKIDFREQKQDLNIDGRRYFVTNYPIFDFHKQVIGYISILNDLSEYYETFYVKELKNLFLFLIGISIAFLFLNKRLQKALTALKNLSTVTMSFKNKDFSALKNKNIEDFSGLIPKNEIETLQNNILEMGCYIRDYYAELEKNIEIKSRELVESNKKIEEQFFTDPLTDLRNLNGLMRDIQSAGYATLAVIKLVNQSTIKALYGIGAGEYILKEIAQLLKRATPSENITVYRIESNRFALLGRGVSINSFYNDVLKDIIYSIEHLSYYYKESEIEIETDTLVGLSEGSERLVEKADIALYDARANNLHYQVYSDELDYLNIFEKNIELSKIIRFAIENDNVTLCYQPIVSKEGEVLKYEALMRLVYNDTLLMPGEFLEFAKETRYYPLLTKKVLDLSFALFSKTKCELTVNLSAKDLKNTDVFSYILKKLKSYPAPANIWFEITESEEIKDTELIGEFVTAVKEYGAKIAIDDFGSGYSNFSYILKIAPDIIKIDGSIIQKIAVDNSAYLTAKAIVSFAKSLNIKTVAEFISSKEILDKALEIGVDEFQGFYFSKPIRHGDILQEFFKEGD